MLASILEIPQSRAHGSGGSEHSIDAGGGDDRGSSDAPSLARSPMVTSTFYSDGRERKHGDDGVELGQVSSPEVRPGPFPRMESTQNGGRYGVQSRFVSHRSAFPSDLFASTIPSLGGGGLVDSADLPDVLRSVLREQNIDFRNDFYWLNRLHSDSRRNPAELERSLHTFRQQRRQGSTSLYTSDVPNLRLPGAHDLPPREGQSSIAPTSPLYPGFHLSGVRTGEGNNIFLPSAWSPPAGSTNQDSPR